MIDRTAWDASKQQALSLALPTLLNSVYVVHWAHYDIYIDHPAYFSSKEAAENYCEALIENGFCDVELFQLNFQYLKGYDHVT